MRAAFSTAPTPVAKLPGLIVELVGPSASGKSTLARAIVEALPSSRLAASARPAEAASATWIRFPPTVARAVKITRAIPHLGGGMSAADAGARLLALLPPDGPLWRLRYRLYLEELTLRLRHERDEGGIAVFDQGFITAVGTLASFNRSIEPETLARALEIAPRPDLVIGIDTPRDVIDRRLRTRLGAQSAAERLFELRIPHALRQIDAFEALVPLVATSGIPLLRVSCPNRESLERVAAAALERIATLGWEAGA